ncbi:MAG: hypothetical protein ACWGQW_19185, partial [bacterium]
MSRDIGERTYREQVYIDMYDQNAINHYVQRFDYETSSMASGTYTVPLGTASWSTGTIYWPNAEEVTTYPSTTAWRDQYGITVATDSDHYWYVVDSNGNWHIDNVSIKPATYAEVMQQKINEAWDLYLRNENHTRNMQERIEREWWAHLEQEKFLEAEHIRLLSEKKANELMSMLIGEEEHRVYEKTGRVFVKGKNGLYMVKKGGGMSKIEGNKIIDFCVHIEHNYKCPPTDHAIALKMMLEEDDSNVIRIANRQMTRTVKELPLAACM